MAPVGGWSIYDNNDEGARVECGLANMPCFVVTPEARVGDLQYHATQFPSLNTFRTDVGAGVDFDVIGFFIAKSTSHPDESMNFFVRLRHRF